ncbi:MAG: DUF1667 domain-containing protein [Anaerocolumna sp.]
MENKELICIGCPLGCMLHVELHNGFIRSITGNTCKVGEDYAKKEIMSPMRIVTTTVKVRNGAAPYVSVKTKADIPKDKIIECMKVLKSCVIDAPVYIGDIILKNAAGTNVNIIATKNVEKISEAVNRIVK